MWDEACWFFLFLYTTMLYIFPLNFLRLVSSLFFSISTLHFTRLTHLFNRLHTTGQRYWLRRAELRMKKWPKNNIVSESVMMMIAHPHRYSLSYARHWYNAMDNRRNVLMTSCLHNFSEKKRVFVPVIGSIDSIRPFMITMAWNIPKSWHYVSSHGPWHNCRPMAKGSTYAYDWHKILFPTLIDCNANAKWNTNGQRSKTTYFMQMKLYECVQPISMT